ncbi:hypothetical protein DICVIV_09943 [Dictyocaulus viviparus]|uniref:Uncharacterized protein n=1 Tax=Dictyocaulus viviparus TaxID=29172 RepID=A0A0D8XJM7_DICVI|nr:hypothetical protein DICVIV_09943 [Dictyocaulus viviparus]
MTQTITTQDKADLWTPFLIFFGVGFLFGLILAFMHVRFVKCMVEDRLSHIPKAKKVKVKKGKKSKKGKKKGRD